MEPPQRRGQCPQRQRQQRSQHQPAQRRQRKLHHMKQQRPVGGRVGQGGPHPGPHTRIGRKRPRPHERHAQQPGQYALYVGQSAHQPECAQQQGRADHQRQGQDAAHHAHCQQPHDQTARRKRQQHVQRHPESVRVDHVGKQPVPHAAPGVRGGWKGRRGGHGPHHARRLRGVGVRGVRRKREGAGQTGFKRLRPFLRRLSQAYPTICRRRTTSVTRTVRRSRAIRPRR